MEFGFNVQPVIEKPFAVGERSGWQRKPVSADGQVVSQKKAPGKSMTYRGLSWDLSAFLQKRGNQNGYQYVSTNMGE